MPYIKKLVMKGFKSFMSKTEVPFSNSMNVVVGPNGSGKSNIADAVCFVLGRLSAKSMRAAKSTNMIFAGTKEHKPAHEASVTLVFDNSDKKFALDTPEIEIERIVRSNGQGIYKINGEPKTRQEVLELLSTVGVDPYGFNIVLQGEISSLVRMSSEDRRKVLEEVAGISIYEIRKEKSIHEMEKTDERLKEVSSILRERTSYLKNLEEERKQALKFKKLQEMEKKCKASILKRKIDEKKKELSQIEERKQEKEKEKSQFKDKAEKIEKKIQELEAETSKIQSTIQKASGVEQESLNNEISDLRAELSGLNVKKENSESRIKEILEKRQKIKDMIKKCEEELSKMRKEHPTQSKSNAEIEKKKEEFSNLEKTRKEYYSLREKLNATKQILQDKEKQIQKNKNEAGFILREIESQDLSYKEVDACKKDIDKLQDDYDLLQKNLDKKQIELIEDQKNFSIANQEISNAEKIKKQVSSMDICPLCKSKMTEEHLKEVFNDCDEKISHYQKIVNHISQTNLTSEIASLKQDIEITKKKISKAEIDLIKLENIEEKKEHLKKLHLEQKNYEQELASLEKERGVLEFKVAGIRDVEEKYDRVFLEIRELSSRTQENLNAELEYKERELLAYKNQEKQNEREEQDMQNFFTEYEKEYQEKEKHLKKKEEEDAELEKRFQKLIEKKEAFDKQRHEQNTFLFENKNKLSLIEQEINNVKIELARINAEIGTLEIDFQPYIGVEIITQPLMNLQAKLSETQNDMMSIGSVNLRALEIYDKIKEEYDTIAEKVKVLENEKLEIMKIIEEIDKKKRKTFIKTLEALNELFNRNFMQLSNKGQVYLELENKEDPFSAGLEIMVKVGHGKYFDAHSLSGGEQTLVALSLIFAIQEYKPYCFYIFDEVDAALDKRNSEKLAGLVKRYMKTGQYIVITHNDSIITESAVLYGVSMQEGVSKILSLEL